MKKGCEGKSGGLRGSEGNGKRQEGRLWEKKKKN